MTHELERRIRQRVSDLEANMDRRDIPYVAYLNIVSSEVYRWNAANPDNQQVINDWQWAADS